MPVVGGQSASAPWAGDGESPVLELSQLRGSRMPEPVQPEGYDVSPEVDHPHSSDRVVKRRPYRHYLGSPAFVRV